MSTPQDQILETVPARIKVPANYVFDVYDKDDHLVAHNKTPTQHDKDVLLDSTAREGNGVDPESAPFKVVFIQTEIPNLHSDSFPKVYNDKRN